MRPVIARSAFMLAPLLLAACGLNGTDKDTDQKQAGKTATAASAPTDPDLAEFETSDVRDTDPRPIMQAQVVLDAQGFGPGVIDGGMGMSTHNALKGFQEANGLQASGELDAATKQALAKWSNVPATRVIRIPESWGQVEFAKVPDEPEDQAKMKHLGYENIAEKLAERFHTTPDVLKELNPGGQPAGSPTTAASGTTNAAEGAPAYPPRTRVTPTPEPSASGTKDADTEVPPFRPGQLVRVPNVGLDGAPAAAAGDDQDWQRTLASLGVKAQQPKAARIVVDKSDGTLKAYDGGDKLLAMFTVTSGSSHDPLPLGDWKINVVSKNPPFHYNPDLFWDADATDEKATLPPGPNGPVGVVWIDLSKEHYGIHGTPEPQTIGRSQSHGCVRLTNWDAARLAQMVDTSTKVVFQA